MQIAGRCRTGLFALAAALLFLARPAGAAIEIKGGGWSASIDGFLNLFMVDTFGQDAPATAHGPDVWSAPTGDNVFRLRTGFLPSGIGFNAAAPEWNGITAKLRVGVYVQLNSINTRTTPSGTYNNSPLIDWRELNVTFSGKFGELLVGRALNLYQADSVLSDISLFGVGIPGQIGGTVLGGWPTLGHIGFGYLYPAFGAQFRYTTPSMAGFKLAFEIGDPSVINGPTGGSSATITKLPDLETTLSYGLKHENMNLKVWVGGIFDRAWFAPGTLQAGAAVNGRGGTAGVNFGIAGLDVVASGFWAEGVGTFQQFDGFDSLDATGAPITSKGYLAQASYKLGSTKLGLNFGQVYADRTDAQNTANAPVLHDRTSVTAGVYHDLTASVKLVAEYSWYELKWYGGASQSGNVVALGGFFFW